MANLKIRALGLPVVLSDKLANQNIVTVKDFLSFNYIELQRKTGLTYQKLSLIVEAVNKFNAPIPVQVRNVITIIDRNSNILIYKASLMNQPSHVKFNDELDLFLQGGIKCGHITEFSGSPGLGKTQLCLQLAISNSLMGKVNGVLYIDSEGAFSPTRLLQIGINKFQLDNKADMEKCLNRIHVWRPENLNEISEKMSNIEVLIIKHGIGLLIIDSMGSIVRRQYGAEQSIERGTKLCSLSSSLKQLAHILNVAIVVTNHVTTKLNPTPGNSGSIIPALGPSWSHWINSRLHLTVVDNKRRVVISKSPELPEIMFTYRITSKGIELDVDKDSV